MSLPHPQAPAERTWLWPALAAGLIVAAAGMHLAYLACDCPLDLAPDEAHYWDWSRHLDWSYYSKGPLVAYLIRLGSAVAGPAAGPGAAALAVRLPAVVCGSLLLASLYLLTVQVYGQQPLGALVVGLALTAPAVAAGASLMTIDAPYTCCWGWALVFGHRAACRRSWWAWPAAGLLLGLGVLAKYTMLLWLPSFALFLGTAPDRRRLLLGPGFWAMVLTGAVCCLPVLVWNVRHHWVGLRHVQGQAGLGAGAAGVRWLGPAEFVGTQFALLLGFGFVGWAAAMVRRHPWKERDAGTSYLWWMSAPMFLVFLLFSLKIREEVNWPVTAYLSGLVLEAGWLVEQLRSPRRGHRRLSGASVAVACGLGLAVTLLMHQGAWARPLLQWLSGPPTPAHPVPLRRFDPTCRLRGWRTLAAEVDRLRARLRGQGVEPLIAGSTWTLPGELGFYCAGHPAAYSLGPALGDRYSQYDFWRPNPVGDPEEFRGRTLIFVGKIKPGLQVAFERLERPHTVTYREGGQPIEQWTVTVCHGFRGFGTAALPDRQY